MPPPMLAEDAPPPAPTATCDEGPGPHEPTSPPPPKLSARREHQHGRTPRSARGPEPKPLGVRRTLAPRKPTVAETKPLKSALLLRRGRQPLRVDVRLAKMQV